MRDIRRWIYLPIFHWNEGQIWEYIEKYNLPYPNLYDQGVSRIGCVICPFLSRKNFDNHRFSRNRWPRFYALFEKKCRQWFELRQSQGYEMYFETADDFISAWYRGNVQYYKYDEYPGQITFEDFF